MGQFILTPYKDSCHEQVVQLYRAVTAKYEHAIFWWPGPEVNHDNVYCAFNEELLVGKGQVEIITIQSQDDDRVNEGEKGGRVESYHQIYMNIKVRPGVSNQEEVFQSLYGALYERALVLAQALPKTHSVQLCVGNHQAEQENSALFVKNGFTPLYRQYEMERELGDMQEIPHFHIPELHLFQTTLGSSEEEERYLRTESTIWPEYPLGLHRLRQLKSRTHFTSFAALDAKQELVASVMVCQEDENSGSIEEVFVVPTWRKKGIASHLIRRGMKYLQDKGYTSVRLSVQTENEKALEVYRSLGFIVSGEEHRYEKDLIKIESLSHG